MDSQTSQTGLNKQSLGGKNKMKNEGESVTPIDIVQGICVIFFMAFFVGFFFSMVLYFYNFFNGLVGQ